MHPPKTPPTTTMDIRSPSPDIQQPVVYARLHHFRGKSSAAKEGRSKQVYNIDALQVVFGREESCDIRIYADNVSRKHCKIVVDLLTGKATLHVLSSHGLKLNRVPLAGETIYTLQDDDIINVMERKFRFEYASGSYEDQDESSLTSSGIPSSPSGRSSAFRPSLVQPILPPSPGINYIPSPARRSTRVPSTPLRHAPSTRMHLFPKDYASEEVRAALVDIGVEMEGSGAETNAATPGRKARKEDFVYLEDREEEDAEEEQIAQQEEVAPVAVPDTSNAFPKATPLSAFSTPQPARKVTRVPRTSLAPRTRKLEKPVPSSVNVLESQTTPQLPQTPSSIPLPPPAETPYFAAPQPSTPTTPSIYPSLDQLNAFTAPQTPTTQPQYSAYQTPRNVPLPEGNDTPYGSFVAQTPQQTNTWEIDPTLVAADEEQESSPVEDVEMEDVSEYQHEQEHSRSPAPHVLALASAPMTPRNVPLPAGEETPYTGAPSTPVSVFNRSAEPASPEENTSSGTMPETPRAIRPLDGQVSLRRRLLLRSAHKVMQEQISRRDMRRTMGVGSGLIGTPMRPQRGVDRSMVLPVSQPMTPITESATTKEAPQTPEGQPGGMEMQMTPSRVALPSPGGTEWDDSLEQDDDEESPMEDYAEPLKDHDESEGEHVSLAMYQTDAGEDEEGEEEDAEGETDHEEDAVYGAGESLSSPATPMEEGDNAVVQQDAYFAGVDGDDAIQFRSPSTSQQLYQSNLMDSVSDDDDLVDRSLDVAPEMDDESDVEERSESEGEESQEEQGEGSVQQETSEEEEEDKENDPLASSKQDEAEQDATQETSDIPASPSRAVRRPIVEEYYTPQPLNRKIDRRGMFGRKSLSSLGGPAVRGTPRSDMAPMKKAFARMSIGDRADVKPDAEDEEMKLEEQTSPILRKAKLETGIDEERDTIPASSRHPAMTVSNDETPDFEIVATPLQGLKNKLKDLRRKSIHVKSEDPVEEKPFNRRATFGIAAPETPNTRETRFNERGMSSAAPLRRFMPKLHRPESKDEQDEQHLAREDVHAEEEETNPESGMDVALDDGNRSQSHSEVENEGDYEQNSAQSEVFLEDDQRGSEGAEEEEDEDAKDGDSSIEEVAMLRDQATSSRTPQTKAHSESPATPMLNGIREMLRTPKAAPGTPQFSGMRQMFIVKPELATPEMSGIVNLFPELERSSQEDLAEESVKSTTTKATSKLPTRNRLAAVAAKESAPARMGVRAPTAASRSRAKPADATATTSQPATSAPSAAVRRPRADATAQEPSLDAKPKVTRAKAAPKPAVNTSTDKGSGPTKKPAARAVRTRTATAEPEVKPATKAPSRVATRALPARTTRAKSAAPVEANTEEKNVEADPLDDINVPEPDPEDIKPVRKPTRSAAATRTATARPLANRSALPQPSQKADSPEPEKPKTRTRTTAAVASRLPKSSTESEEMAAPTKKVTRAAVGSRLTAPTASSKARANSPPVLPPAPVRKTRAAATTAGAAEPAEPSGIPKRVTRARK